MVSTNQLVGTMIHPPSMDSTIETNWFRNRGRTSSRCMVNGETSNPICEPWCWNIYQHVLLKSPSFVGK